MVSEKQVTDPTVAANASSGRGIRLSTVFFENTVPKRAALQRAWALRLSLDPNKEIFDVTNQRPSKQIYDDGHE